MFGYVTVNKQELKFKEFDQYHAYYCGLCRQLREKYGFSGQFALSYDCTFLVMFLTGLYEPEEESKRCKCVLHPAKGTPCTHNVFSEYAADMTILLSYYKCMDDWKDEHKSTRYAYAKLLEKGYQKIAQKYPQKCEIVKSLFDKISLCEKQKEESLDKVSGLFGEVLAEIFAYKEDEWVNEVRRMAFFLGKFVYLMDAYEDLEKDKKTGNYNPFIFVEQNEEYEEKCRSVLAVMMAECSKEFEKLPILQNIEIMRNIIYSGVWCKYEMIQQKKKQKAEQGKEESNE